VYTHTHAHIPTHPPTQLSPPPHPHKHTNTHPPVDTTLVSLCSVLSAESPPHHPHQAVSGRAPAARAKSAYTSGNTTLPFLKCYQCSLTPPPTFLLHMTHWWSIQPPECLLLAANDHLGNPLLFPENPVRKTINPRLKNKLYIS